MDTRYPVSIYTLYPLAAVHWLHIRSGLVKALTDQIFFSQTSIYDPMTLVRPSIASPTPSGSPLPLLPLSPQEDPPPPSEVLDIPTADISCVRISSSGSRLDLTLSQLPESLQVRV